MSTAQPTIQQLTFIEAFLRGVSATSAAREAGYPNPLKDGWRVLQLPSVKAYINEYRAMAAERNGINADMLMAHLAGIIRFDVSKLYGPDGKLLAPSDWDADTRAAINAIEETQFGRKTKAYDKLGAITLAMKHLGLLVERVEHSGEVSVVGMAARIRERAAKAAPEAAVSQSDPTEGFA